MFSLGFVAMDAYVSFSTYRNAVVDLDKWIRYLSPKDINKLRPRLFQLERRVDALRQPLSLCLTYCQSHGSATADVVFQTKDTIEEVERFIIGWSAAKKSSDDIETISKRIDTFLHELEFASSALSLSLNVINFSGKFTCDSFAVSPSSLLRASNRLKYMLGMGGDVACAYGLLFVKSKDSPEWTRWSKESCLKVVYEEQDRKYDLVVEDTSSNEPVNQKKVPIRFDLSFDLDLQFKHPQVPIGMDSGDIKDSEKVFSWSTKLAKESQDEYAFFAYGLQKRSIGDISFASGALRPLGFFYCIRLCAYENVQSQRFPSESKGKELKHLIASDEELATVLSSV